MNDQPSVILSGFGDEAANQKTAEQQFAAFAAIGLNKVGIRRNGYTPEQIVQLKEAYRVIYREGRRWSEVLAILKTDFSTGPAAAFHEFFKSGKRGFVQERRISRRATLKIADPGQDESEQSDNRRREAA